MSRYITTICIFICVIAVLISSTVYINKCTESLEELAVSAESLSRQDKFEEAEAVIVKMNTSIEKKQKASHDTY